MGVIGTTLLMLVTQPLVAQTAVFTKAELEQLGVATLEESLQVVKSLSEQQQVILGKSNVSRRRFNSPSNLDSAVFKRNWVRGYRLY